MRQNTLRLEISPCRGESVADFRFRRGEFKKAINGQASRKVPEEKLLADLLKRKCRSVMADITQCQANTLPAHIARLEDLADIIEHHLRHELKHTPESSLSGRQLLYPTTLADFLACLEITRKEHRCPEFVNPMQDKHDEILRKLDTIAFFVSQNPNTNTVIEDEQ